MLHIAHIFNSPYKIPYVCVQSYLLHCVLAQYKCSYIYNI